MGTSTTGCLAHARPGASPVCRNIGPDQYSGSRTSQARKITWTSERMPTGASTPLPSGASSSTACRLNSQFLTHFLSKLQRTKEDREIVCSGDYRQIGDRCDNET